jgi:hypothetical protein
MSLRRQAPWATRERRPVAVVLAGVGLVALLIAALWQRRVRMTGDVEVGFPGRFTFQWGRSDRVLIVAGVVTGVSPGDLLQTLLAAFGRHSRLRRRLPHTFSSMPGDSAHPDTRPPPREAGRAT